MIPVRLMDCQGCKQQISHRLINLVQRRRVAAVDLFGNPRVVNVTVILKSGVWRPRTHFAWRRGHLTWCTGEHRRNG